MPYQRLKIKKGLDIRVSGRPDLQLRETEQRPYQVAMLPEHIPHVKPRLLVAQGDTVAIGTPLFEDKQNTGIRFLSPGAGRISHIQFGPRRVIQAIVIDIVCDGEEASLAFPVVESDALGKLKRETLIDLITTGGMWWAFRQLPFRDIPDPQDMPPMIVVALGAGEPFQPEPDVYLRDREALFAYGLRLLEVLCGRPPIVAVAAGQRNVLEHFGDIVTHVVYGHYPSDDPAAVVFHLKKSPKENRTWFISGQDLLSLATLLSEGRYPVERVISVAGEGVQSPTHYHTRMGVSLAHLVGTRTKGAETRYIVGGMLRGFESSDQGFMGLYETALNLMPLGHRAEFMTLFRPGWRKPTYSRTFVSRLNPGVLTYNCNLGGEQRPCIACMHCADVCPVDILPELTYKAILAEEVEEYVEHGLLDCVECGLCTYVCPSKIELTQTFMAAKATYAKERVEQQ